jgi:hypothetical protein
VFSLFFIDNLYYLPYSDKTVCIQLHMVMLSDIFKCPTKVITEWMYVRLNQRCMCVMANKCGNSNHMYNSQDLQSDE